MSQSRTLLFVILATLSLAVSTPAKAELQWQTPSTDWLKRTEVQGNFTINSGSTYNFRSWQPLLQSADQQQTVLMQISGWRYKQNRIWRDAGNFGAAYRYMPASKAWVAGINGFYDYEFSGGNQRTSLGLDFDLAPLEFTANRYWHIGGDERVNNALEQSLAGYDFEIGSTLPFMPWAKAFGTYRSYDEAGSTQSQRLLIASAEIKILPHTLLLLSSTDSNRTSRANAIGLRITLLDNGAPSIFTAAQSGNLFADKAFKTGDSSSSRTANIRRDNRIILGRP